MEQSIKQEAPEMKMKHRDITARALKAFIENMDRSLRHFNSYNREQFERMLRDKKIAQEALEALENF